MNVVQAIEYGATRIGHGVALKEMPEKIALAVEKNIVFEMAPTSNFQTKTATILEDYPFEEFRRAGIKVTVNTDNRTVSDTTLNNEFLKLATFYDYGYDEFEEITQNAVFGAFITDDEKEKLSETITNGFAELKNRA
jgi:adenosine deaminase